MSRTVFDAELVFAGDVSTPGWHQSTGALDLSDLAAEASLTFDIEGAAGRILIGAYLDVHEAVTFTGGDITEAAIVTGVDGDTDEVTTTLNLGGLSVGRHQLPLGDAAGTVISDDVLVTLSGTGGNLDGLDGGAIEVHLLTMPALGDVPVAPAE